MAAVNEIPVVDVTSDNFLETWPTLMLSIKTSTFLALDLELSGLGNRKKLMAQSVDDRYKAISEVAKTRSVLSVGISCFKVTDSETPTNPPQADSESDEDETHADESGAKTDKVLPVYVQTYNLTVLCNEDYVVEPKSLQFLVEHGFDFNKQYSKGVLYQKGNDMETKSNGVNVRNLFSEIITSRKPIVLHNGLIDLIFLYQSFYATLPTKLSSFIADMSEMFPAGVFDTKYLAEFKARMPASYLEYVFRRCQRQNEHDYDSDKGYVSVSYPRYPGNQPHISYQSCRLQSDSNEEMCQQFANHGYCPSGSKCKKSHNISNVLDRDFAAHQKKRQRNRKRKRNRNSEAEEVSVATGGPNTTSPDGSSLSTHEETPGGENGNSDSQNILRSESSHSPSAIENGAKCENKNGAVDATAKTAKYGNHRAGFDAFMTGFAMATFFLTYGDHSKSEEAFSFPDAANRISLSGKDVPLLITKSNFAKTSADHKTKFAKLFPQNVAATT